MVILYLGFPASWDRWMLALTGLVIVIVSYRSSVGPMKADSNDKKEVPYVDHHSSVAPIVSQAGSSAVQVSSTPDYQDTPKSPDVPVKSA
jgi:hypothetical protein